MRVLSLVLGLLACAAVWADSSPHRLSLVRTDRVTRASAAVTGTVDVSPTLIDNGDWVTVSYTSSQPGLLDFVAAYSPADADFSQTTPVDYRMAAADPNYLTTKSGSLQFSLTNMRADFAFVLYTGSVVTPVLVARSAQNVTFRNLNAPLKPRVLLTGVPGEMRLMWSSASASLHPRAQWGLAAGSYVHSVAASSSTYGAADMCGAPATTTGYRDIGFIHEVVFTGLAAGTTVHYQFGDDSEMSADFELAVPPAAGQGTETRLVAYGDMGQQPRDTASNVYANPPSLNTSRLVAADVQASGFAGQAVVHIGDISYARGYSAEWDVFLDQITPIASRVPYMVSLGNHERDFPAPQPGSGLSSLYNGTDSGGECGVPAERLFHVPRAAASPDQQHYSFDVGLVHVLLISTEMDFSTGSDQYQFILSDLASVNRSVTPWVIFGLHRPMYIDSTNWDVPAGDQPVAVALRQYVEPLLVKFGVDLVIQGHHHSYQRHCASFNGTCVLHSDAAGVFWNPTVPVQMVIGTAGAGYSTNIMPTPPPYTERVLFEYGYARIRVNATALAWEFVADSNGTVIDTMAIVRTRTRA